MLMRFSLARRTSTFANIVGIVAKARTFRSDHLLWWNYKRLAALKKKYDPDNIFRINQNIQAA
jgi:FAD/FMN-containing dehydrogenase